MTRDHWKRCHWAGAIIALLAGAAAALAQTPTYPSRPVTMMVGFPPGGPTDTLARILGDAMQKTLGQPVVIETASGGQRHDRGGSRRPCGAGRYTIGIGNWSSHVGSPAIYAIDFDVFKDLQPISLLTTAPMIILVQEWLAAEHGDRARLMGEGAAAADHIRHRRRGSARPIVRHFLSAEGRRAVAIVPYRGAAPAMQDLIGGQIELACLEASSSLANVEAGRYRAYAVLSETRWPKLPDTPTMIESRRAGTDDSFWHGLWTTARNAKEHRRPPGHSRAERAGRSHPCGRASRQSVKSYSRPISRNPAALLAFHKAETDKWWPIFKTAGIKPNSNAE